MDFFIKGKNVLKNNEVLFTLWLQIPIYGKFFSLHCQYTLPVIDQNHFEYPPHLRSDYGQKYLYISYGNRFQIQPSEIAPMLQTCQGRNSWIQPRIKLLILMQNKFFCTQSFDIFIVHVRKNKMNIMWNWIKVHQKQEEIENALVFIFFFSWYSFRYDWFNTRINSM